MQIWSLGTKLVIIYVLIVGITYAVFLASDNPFPWFLLLASLTLPFSVVAGIVIAGFSHSSYPFSPDKGFIVAAIINCFFIHLLIRLLQRPK